MEHPKDYANYFQPLSIFSQEDSYLNRGQSSVIEGMKCILWDMIKIWNCPNLSGCFMFLRNSVLKQVGSFDDKFFMYFEDTDLIRRIHRVSKTVFYPNATIIHAHKAEHRTSKLLLKISVKSAIQYFNKYGWIFDKERRIYNRQAQRTESCISK